MKRWIGSLLAVGIGLVTASACVENRGSLQVIGVMVPPVPMMGMGCQYQPSQTAPILFSGHMDIALTNQYEPALLIENQMVARGNNTQLRVETSSVEIEGATVRITDAVGNQITSYTTVGSGFAPASSGSTPGFGAVSVIMVDPQTAMAISGEVAARGSKRLITYTKVYGHTLGGLKIEAAEFIYPVDVCSGCLVDFSSGMCNSTMATSLTAPCIIGQDQVVDCRICYKLFPVCRQ